MAEPIKPGSSGDKKYAYSFLLSGTARFAYPADIDDPSLTCYKREGGLRTLHRLSEGRPPVARIFSMTTENPLKVTDRKTARPGRGSGTGKRNLGSGPSGEFTPLQARMRVWKDHLQKGWPFGPGTFVSGTFPTRERTPCGSFIGLEMGKAGSGGANLGRHHVPG